ncbi:MAG TPA: DUF1844 domain-containing protein [Planctomycetaceae bacterium]|jgi:hypothetical protein|nr:DUF1844 domain-containing protein [Planctomycetaceae bacterium]
MTGNETRNEPGHDTEGGPGIAAGQKVEITADEDWKSRVKAEDAALDQQFQHADATATKPETGEAARPAEPRTETREGSARREAPPLPEPSLATLLGMLSTQAMVALGLLPNPATRKAEKELPLARYFIDLIGVLEKKTAGNLDPDEAAALDETLHTLRMAYVQRLKETA